MVLEASYKSKAEYNAARQCYVTNLVKNNRVVNNNFADSVNGSVKYKYRYKYKYKYKYKYNNFADRSVPVLSDTTSATTSTSTQVKRMENSYSLCKTQIAARTLHL